MSSDPAERLLHSIIEKEYEVWLNDRKLRPLSLNDIIAVGKSLGLDSVMTKRLVNKLLSEGLLVEERSGYMSYPAAQLLRFTDLRKYTGACTTTPSAMRTLGFDLRLCRLGLPDFGAVKASALARRLRGRGGAVAARAASVVEALDRAGLYTSYSREQSEIMEELAGALDSVGISAYVIDLPTGSGKTESFMLPSIAAAMADGLAIIVYPRVALETDQLRRLIRIYYGLVAGGIALDKLPYATVYDGKSCSRTCRGNRSDCRPCKGSFSRAPRVTTSSGQCSVEYTAPKPGVKLDCNGASLELPVTDQRWEELIDKGAYLRIIITNYDMFNRMISNLQRRSFDADYLLRLNPRRIILVFDEAHEFRDVKFLHLIMLVSRFLLTLRRLGINLPVTLVFSSATLPDKFDTILSRVIAGVTGGSTAVKILPRRRAQGRTRTLLVAAVLPDPETSGQWLAQLGLFTSTTFSLARYYQHKDIFKNLLFVDSLRYQRDIFRNTMKTLMSEAPRVIPDHAPSLYGCQASLSPALDWTSLLANRNVSDNVASHLADPRFQSFQPPQGGLCSQRYVLASHHAGLGETERHTLEAALKRCSFPVSVVATSTLEMGVDIPSIATVLQFRKPPSEASMIQRIGRAARSSTMKYAGAAAVFLTNMPSDALLVLDPDMFNRYLYACQPGAPKPSTRAPINKTTMLNHFLLTAVSNYPLTAREFATKLPRSIKDVEAFAEKLLTILRKSRGELEQLARSILDAYHDAGLTVESYTSSDLIAEMENDLLKLRAISKTMTRDLVDAVKKFKEERGVNSVESYLLSLPVGKFIYGLTALLSDSRRPETDELLEQMFADYILHNNIIIVLQNSFSDDERSALSQIDSHIEGILSDVNSLDRAIRRLEIGIAESVDAAAGALTKSIESIEQGLEELKKDFRKSEQLLRHKLLRDPSLFDKIVASIDAFRDFLEELRSVVERTVERMSLLRQLGGKRIYRVLAELAGKPYFNVQLQSPPVTVKVGIDCTRGGDNPSCKTNRDDEPLTALWRSIPLTVGGDLDEPSFSCLPPWGDRRSFDVEALVIALDKSGSSFYIKRLKQTDLGKVVADILALVYGGLAKTAFESSNDGINIIYGKNAEKLNILLYSKLSENLIKILESNLGITNPLFVAFKISRRGRAKSDELTVIMRIGRPTSKGQGATVEPYKPSHSIPVAYCRAANVLFIGADLGGVKPSPTVTIQCPIADMAKRLAQLAGALGSKSGPSYALKELASFCPHIDKSSGSCTHSSARGSVEATDVYNYMIRTNPLLFVDYVAESNAQLKTIRIGKAGGQPSIALRVSEGSLEASYNWVRVTVRRDQFIYPLPVKQRARVQKTYGAVVNIERSIVERIARTVMGLLLSSSYPEPLVVKWLLARLVLATAGTSGFKWNSYQASLRRNLSAGNVGGVAATLIDMLNEAIDAIEYALTGKSFLMTTSGVRRGAEFLLDIAVENPAWVQILYDGLRQVARDPAAQGRLKEWIERLTEVTLAHLTAYAVGELNDYGNVVKLHRARLRGSAGKGWGYLLVEQHEGGIGYLPTLTSQKVRGDVRRSLAIAAQAMSEISQSRRRAEQNIKQILGGRGSAYQGAVQLVEAIAARTAKAYGAVRYGPTSTEVIYTFIPSWLARTVLTSKKLNSYANVLGVSLAISNEEWSHMVPEVLPAFFDTDFPDAPALHIGGLDSWLGEYERRLFQSNLLALIAYGYIV